LLIYELSTDAATELIKAVIKHVRTSFFTEIKSTT